MFIGGGAVESEDLSQGELYWNLKEVNSRISNFKSEIHEGT